MLPLPPCGSNRQPIDFDCQLVSTPGKAGDFDVT